MFASAFLAKAPFGVSLPGGFFEGLNRFVEYTKSMDKCKCKRPGICVDDGFVFRKTVIPATLGDDITGQDIPVNGAYKNTLVEYEANGAVYIYDSTGSYTKVEATDAGIKTFDELSHRPKYAGSAMTSKTNIPEVTDATFTIKRNNETIGGFSANAESDSEVNIAVPTAVSELVNDEGYAKTADLPPVDTTYNDTSDNAIANSTVTNSLDREVVTNIDLASTPSTTTVQLDATKVNLKAPSLPMVNNISLPVASSTQAGVINSATYDAITNNTNNINALINGAVAITGLDANPSQSDLTTAWQTATGIATLINRAGIYDVDNSKVWTYYTNDTTWYAASNTAQVTVNQFTNSAAGIIKGSTSAGQVAAEADGTGTVNGWSTLSGTVSDNTSKLATIAQGAEVNVQSNWNEADATSDAYIQNKPTIISLTLSSTDIGEGADLPANTLYGVYN